MARDPYRYFRIEARELLDQLSRAALDLEKGGSAELVAHMLRLAHTLKGAARVVRCTEIGDCAHAIEDALEPLRASEQRATRAQIDTVLRYLDEINAHLALLSSPEPAQDGPVSAASGSMAASGSASAAQGGAEDVQRAVRVDIGEMDNLLDGFVEVHAQLGSLRDGFKQAQRARSLTDLLAAQLERTGRDAKASEVGALQARSLAEQIAASLDGLNRHFASGIEQLDRELKQVRDAAERMRLLPAGSLFVALERAARDAAQVQNKQIQFEGRGGDVRLDAQVLGAVQGALSHAVRNAVAHGIETAAERQAAGKPPAGRVAIEVSQRGKWIVFTCTDDGRGVDLDAIRRIALQRGLLAGGSQPSDSATLLKLLLSGGISTAGAVTEVAGRGIGLDVVRDAAERLDGRVELQSESGRGTTLTFTAPLSISALDGLQVEAGGVIATIPIDAVSRTLRVAPAEIARTAQGESLIHDACSIPFLPLRQALAGAADRPAPNRGGRTWSVVIVKADCGVAAIGVDRLLGAANIVLRPLPALAPAKAIVAGVSLDMAGNPQLVLDPRSLVLEAQRAGAVQQTGEAAGATILVVDDSLTTRMLERSILESAGYVVELAVSGEEAIEKAGRNRYALFLVDVEMPGMDGFTFIERTRADPDLRHIPAILVTSRASPEDLARGRDVGACGHIVKSEFDQGVLLARIDELVRRA